jgi:hypothetical protein
MSKFELLYSNKSIFTLIISMLIIIIMDGSLTIFCTPKSNRIINISNSELYLIYSIVFIVSNIILLKIVTNITSTLKKYDKFLYIVILTIQSLLSITLLTIYGLMTLYSNYPNLLIYLIVYSSFLSSIGFLSILTIKLLHWFSRTRNYLTLMYGIAILLFILNTIVGLMYLTEVLSTHGDIIKPASCRAIFASLFNLNPNLSIILSNLFDITSIISFIAIWLATTIMLKQYSHRIGKIKYWILVSIPLVVFLIRYEVMFYYFINDPAILDIFYVELGPNLNPIINILLNSNLQFGGIFFAIAFLVIAKKIPKRHKIVNSLIISLFGMMFLVGSKDISALIIPSFPPVGIIAISYMGLASYLLLLGIYSSATIAARDINLRTYLNKMVGNDTSLLTNIALSEKESEIEKNVKSLMKYSEQWQENYNPLEMNQQEIREIIDDVIAEVRKTVRKDDKIK